jgi:hypothetical protein
MKIANNPSINTHASVRWALYLIVPFCGFYTVKFGFSPIYLTFVLGIFFLFIGSLFGIKRLQEKSSVLISVLILIYITILLFVEWGFDQALSSAWINIAFSLLYYITTSIILDNTSRNSAIRASELTIVFSIILLAAELGYRLTHPMEPQDWNVQRDDIYWYVYKTSSFMYPDSNSVGLFVACLIGFILGLPTAQARDLRKYLLPLSLLLLGSISRSAIIAIGIVLLYQYLNGNRTKLILFVITSSFVGLFVYSQVIMDESFLSKFWITGLAINYLETADILALIVGVGPGNAERVLGVGAHLLPLTLLIELGIAGTLLMVVFWLSIWKRAGQHGTPIFLALLVNGLSFSTFAMPWFYSMAAALVYFSRIQTSARLSSYPRI